MDINEMDNQIRSSEGYRIHVLMRALDMSLQIFRKNYCTFLQLISMFEDPMFQFSYWADGEKAMLTRTNYQVEIYRTFTNFEASAAALIDHSRYFIKTDIKDAIKEAYEQKKNECFVSNGLACFIKNLRNYLLHRGYPNISITTDLQNGTSFTMDKNELMEWKGWSSGSKQYFKKQDDAISVVSIATDYYKIVVDFYEWFFNELRAAYKTEYEEVNRLINLFNATFFGE